jgi:Flp pilus assembly pilin Flp
MKHVEYVLLTAFTGVIAIAFGGLMWPALSKFTTVFTQIAQALQGNP